MVSKKIYNSKDDKKFEEIIKRLRKMRLPVMAELLLSMKDNGELLSKNIVDILDEITENEVVSRKNNTISKLKKKAKFSQPMASLNEIKYTADRKLNKELISKLSTNKYIGERKNIIVLGACGTGKSYLVNALGNHACDSLFSVRYVRMYDLLADFADERLVERSTRDTMRKYIQPSVLIIDDFLITPLDEKECFDLFTLLDYRISSVGSVIICSQLEITEWHKQLGGNILADGVLDRLSSKAYKIIISGDSLRKE